MTKPKPKPKEEPPKDEKKEEGKTDEAAKASGDGKERAEPSGEKGDMDLD